MINFVGNASFFGHLNGFKVGFLYLFPMLSVKPGWSSFQFGCVSFHCYGIIFASSFSSFASLLSSNSFSILYPLWGLVFLFLFSLFNPIFGNSQIPFFSLFNLLFPCQFLITLFISFSTKLSSFWRFRPIRRSLASTIFAIYPKTIFSVLVFVVFRFIFWLLTVRTCFHTNKIGVDRGFS